MESQQTGAAGDLTPPDYAAIPPPPPDTWRPTSRLRSRAATGIVAVGLLGGAMVGGYAIANAATSTASPSPSAGSSSDSNSAAPPARAPFDPIKGGHVGANGVVETLLTGTTADKARAAALAAVPGGTVQRVENDAEGATYEAHMLKSDGMPVTVKMDANFKVTGIETGPPAH